MNSAKKRAIILMVSGAVIGAVAVGVYFLQNDRTPPTTATPPTATSTPSIFDMEPIIPEAKVSTEGWKTCRNEEYGYEFQFPGEWHIYGEDARGEPDEMGKTYFVDESSECIGAIIIFDENGIDTYRTGGFGFNTIHVSVQPVEESQYDVSREFVVAQDQSKSTMTLVTVNGHKGVRQIYQHTSMYGGRGWNIWVAKQDYIYMISGGLYDEQEEIIQTIFSTFRFLDTASSTTATSPAV